MGQSCLVDPSPAPAASPPLQPFNSNPIRSRSLSTMQPHRTWAAVVISGSAGAGGGVSPEGAADPYAVHPGRPHLQAQAAAPASARATAAPPSTRATAAPPSARAKAYPSAAEEQARLRRQILENKFGYLHDAVYLGSALTARHILVDAPQVAAVRANGSGDTFLHLAAEQGSVKVMQVLVEAAPSTLAAVNDKQLSALHVAALSGSEQALCWLLRAAPQLAAAQDANGRTAMHFAAATAESAAMVQELAKSSSALARTTDSQGQTPLHAAAYWAKKPAIKALLKLAPKTATAVDSSRQTPLHIATDQMSFGDRCRLESLRMLFEAAPAAARMQDSSGRTPLELLLGNAYGGGAASRELGVRNPQATLQLLRASHQLADPSALAACLAACLPLSPFVAASLPAACLAAALPTALAHSPAQAHLLVAHLPPADAACLRTLAMCLARLQRTAAAPLPLPLLQRILAQAGSLLY